MDGGNDGDARPLVIALQELTPPLESLLQPRLEAAGYRQLVRQRFEDIYHEENRYGVALGTRAPLGELYGGRFVPYTSTRMNRGLVLGRATWPGVGWLVFGSTHLESWVGDDNQHWVIPNRQSQLQEACRLLIDEARAHGCVGACLLGDFNWSDGSDGEALAGLPEWADAYEACGRPAKTYATNYGKRLDRCLYWNHPNPSAGRILGGDGAPLPTPPTRTLKATQIRLHGERKVGNLTVPTRAGGRKPCLPSDHKALHVTLEAAVNGRRVASSSVQGSASSAFGRPLAPAQMPTLAPPPPLTAAPAVREEAGGGRKRKRKALPAQEDDVVCLSD